MFDIENAKFRDILDIESLHIPKEKVTCIVGESGSGKTTFLKLLNLMNSVDSGQILYNGVSIENIDSISLRREVVMLSQNPSIFKGAIKDNLLIGLKFSEKPMVSDEKLEQILKEFSLEKRLDEDAQILSGGEKQRVALARVILMEPNVLLLDEPSSSLDDETEMSVIEKVVDYIKAAKKSLIIVTHSKDISVKFSDFIVEISKGKVKSTREIKTNGQNN